MCLGIPGRLAEFDDTNPHLAVVEVTGVRRRINVGLLEDEPLAVGDWVLIHVGFAMSRIDEAEADRALDRLKLMVPVFDENRSQLMETGPC
ncbi:HypC/HybG/HupF family hydrogenase formation chaperone [soil metagenome]